MRFTVDNRVVVVMPKIETSIVDYANVGFFRSCLLVVRQKVLFLLRIRIVFSSYSVIVRVKVVLDMWIRYDTWWQTLKTETNPTTDCQASYIGETGRNLTMRLAEHPGGVLLGIFGGGVPLASPNLDPISDHKMPFPTPVFRPGLKNRNPFSDLRRCLRVLCGQSLFTYRAIFLKLFSWIEFSAR